MRHVFLATCVLIAAASSDGGNKKAAAAKTIVDGEVGSALDAWMVATDHFPKGFSGTVLVAKDHHILLAKGYGVARAQPAVAMAPDAIWDWASVTKQFTAAAVLKLEMEKKLKVGDPIRKYLKDVPKDKAAVTFHHLLTHTSGITDQGAKFEKVDPSDRETTVRTILSLELKSEPGKKWEYSNTGYFLLAALIEKVAGTNYEKYVQDHLFTPAGMEESGFIGDGKVDLTRVPCDERGTGPQFVYGPKLNWGYRGAGGALASSQDLLKWDEALRGEKLLSKAAKEVYFQPVLDNYACGWEVAKGSGGTRVEHSGHVGHVVTYYLRLLDEPLVVALATNEEPATHPATIAHALVDIARRGKGH